MIEQRMGNEKEKDLKRQSMCAGEYECACLVFMTTTNRETKKGKGFFS